MGYPVRYWEFRLYSSGASEINSLWSHVLCPNGPLLAQLELYAKPPSHQNPWVGCNGRASQVWEPCTRNRLHPRNRAKRQSTSIPARLSPTNMSLGGTVWGFGLRGRVDRVTVQENIPSMSRAIILPNKLRVHACIQISELVLNSGGNCRT